MECARLSRRLCLHIHCAERGHFRLYSRKQWNAVVNNVDESRPRVTFAKHTPFPDGRKFLPSLTAHRHRRAAHQPPNVLCTKALRECSHNQFMTNWLVALLTRKTRARSADSSQGHSHNVLATFCLRRCSLCCRSMNYRVKFVLGRQRRVPCYN